MIAPEFLGDQEIDGVTMAVRRRAKGIGVCRESGPEFVDITIEILDPAGFEVSLTLGKRLLDSDDVRAQRFVAAQPEQVKRGRPALQNFRAQPHPQNAG